MLFCSLTQVRQSLAPILPILSEEIWQAESWIDKQDDPEFAEMELDGDEKTFEKYFDDVETVLSCRWVSPATWWKGDEELDSLFRMAMDVRKLCLDTYGPPNRRGKLKMNKGISYGVGGKVRVSRS